VIYILLKKISELATVSSDYSSVAKMQEFHCTNMIIAKVFTLILPSLSIIAVVSGYGAS